MKTGGGYPSVYKKSLYNIRHNSKRIKQTGVADSEIQCRYYNQYDQFV